MNAQPARDPRVSGLERRQINTDTRLEEIAEEISTELTEIKRDFKEGSETNMQYFVKLEEEFGNRFNIVETRLDKVENRLDKVENRLDKIESTLYEIKVNMAAMENRILDAFAQLVTLIEPKRLQENEKQ